MKFKPFTPQKFRRRVFSQLWMLALQFVLGMGLNVIGREASGVKHTIYVVVLVVHILNAIGLVEGGIFIGLKAPSRLAWWTTAALTIALGAGILTARTGSDVWSFVMACAFLISAWLYVMLYVQADRALHAGEMKK